MARLAQADILVERSHLGSSTRRLELRRELYEALRKLGHVESVVRYVKDPKDGPLYDNAVAGDVDLDHHAIVRVIGYVTPFRTI